MDQADTLEGDASANQIVGGQGDDTLVGNGGADVLRGGEGNDVLAVSSVDDAFRLDGGTGIDTLRLDAEQILDFTALSDLAISSIEQIDLTMDDGNSELTLNLTDVLSLSESSNTLSIFGDSGDAVNLSNSSNGQTGVWSLSSSASGLDSYTFTSMGDILSIVEISDTIDTNII